MVARYQLEVPRVFAGVCVQGEDGAGVEVVAASTAEITIPGVGISCTYVHEIELGVEDDRVPHGAPTTGQPPFTVPGLRGALYRVVF